MKQYNFSDDCMDEHSQKESDLEKDLNEENMQEAYKHDSDFDDLENEVQSIRHK